MTSVIAPIPEPTIEVVEENGLQPRLTAARAIIQHANAQAFGSPSDARRLGASAVDRHDGALRRLARS